MATVIYVVCRSAEPVTYAELENVMGHMGWLDGPATFAPPLDKTNGADPQWRSFEVTWDPTKRPISVSHVFEDDRLATAATYIREKLENADIDVTDELGDLVDSAQQVFVFEISDDPRQDVWEMVDAAEAFLARERDGLIVSDEGVFDGAMQRVA